MFTFFNSMSFVISIPLWKHHYNQDNEYILPPKTFPIPPPISALQATNDLLSITMHYFAFCRILCKWSQTAHILFCVAFSTQYHYFEIDLWCWVYQEFIPFSLLSSNPLYEYTPICLPIYQLINIWVFTVWTKLLWIFLYRSLYVTVLSFLLGKYLEGKWLGHKLDIYFTF